MNFADNLRDTRKKRGISQEELAERLGVSRQAVSKWEQGEGYPETEKLFLLARELGVSLDRLAFGGDGKAEPERGGAAPTGRILIRSQDGKSVVNCYKVLASPPMKGGAKGPRYALFGVDGSTFWGENGTLLGWYVDEPGIQKEVEAILEALKNGEPSYTLRYAARVKSSPLRVRLEEERATPSDG